MIEVQELAVPQGLADPHLDLDLYLLQHELESLGKSLETYSMSLPSPQLNFGSGHSQAMHIEQFDPAGEEVLYSTLSSSLNTSQLAVFDTIKTAVNTSPATAHFFLEGTGGTGKTYLYRTLCSYYRSKGFPVLCVASTGIASLLLPGGRTVYSFFSASKKLDEAMQCSINASDTNAALLQAVKLIIWDKVPMQHRFIVESVDRCLQDITKVYSIFSGIPVLFGGNWAQILPIVPDGTRCEIVNACLCQSYIWLHLRVLFFTINMRAVGAENIAYTAWLGNMSVDRTLNGALQLPSFFHVYSDL